MDLNRFLLGRKAITFNVVLNPDSDDDTAAEEEHKVIAKEAPLPELISVFGELPPIVCRILRIPVEWAEGLRVFKLSVHRTKQKTRSVSFKFTKVIDLGPNSSKLHTMETLWVRIDPPEVGESGSLEVSEDDQAVIFRALLETERYAKGERSQKLLNLDEDAQGLNALANQGRQPELAIVG